jgi:hypothetical protein
MVMNTHNITEEISRHVTLNKNNKTKTQEGISRHLFKKTKACNECGINSYK